MTESSSEESQSSYWERPYRLTTSSGYEVKSYYTADDLPDRDVGEPGEFPYVRGLYEDGYRGRLWTRREIAGFGRASDTNERFHYLLEHGASGLNCHFDLPTHLGIDPDHPLADGDIGGAGPSICKLDDMRELLEGLPLDDVSMSLISSTNSAAVLTRMYVMVADEQDVDRTDLRGTTQNDPLHARYCGYEASCPVSLGVKLATDVAEFSLENLPNWYTHNVNMYDLREHGISAPQELAFGFALAIVYLDALAERGIPVTEAAGRLAFYCSLHTDLLEEVAKLRAARLVWSKLLHERYGAAKDSRAAKFRIGSQTAGSTIVPQQPLNNLIRVAYQALVGALAGVSSIHTCGFDEAIGLPSPLAHKLALRTQQILAYETGVPLVNDPLGGSFYVENHTERIAQDTLAILEDIDDRGGMIECVRSGWLDGELKSASVNQVREIENDERRIVGVNWAVDEEDDTTTPGGAHPFSMEVNDDRIREIKHYKERRDHRTTIEALRSLRDLAATPDVNLMSGIETALRADATLGEILGVIREAHDLPYDPIGIIDNPFKDEL